MMGTDTVKIVGDLPGFSGVQIDSGTPFMQNYSLATGKLDSCRSVGVYVTTGQNGDSRLSP
ncbi:MAG: hypothetical protein O3A01_08595 [bacterium]|nr:hypothetical protein [bacterium]